MLPRIAVGLLLTLFFPSWQAEAAESSVELLKRFLASTHALKADFEQVVLDESGRPAQRSQGRFFLQRPGRFRWDYEQPYHQEIVSDGEKVWFYDADLEQVTVKRLDQAIGSTPALLLSGELELEQNFRLENQGRTAGLAWIKLWPRSENSSFQYILIGMDGKALERMELSDNFGQLTRIYFSNVKTNLRLDPNLFQFTPPAGADVFEG